MIGSKNSSLRVLEEVSIVEVDFKEVWIAGG